MRSVRLIGVIALALVLGGCINSTTVIHVRSDGTGTIDQSTTMTAQAAAQMKAMMAGFGEAGKEKPASTGLFSEKDMREAAAKMGEGVTFVSAQPIHTAQQEGMRATYAFTDIRKLRLSEKPNAPGGGGGMPTVGGSDAEDLQFRFARTPSGSSVITVVFPQPKPDAKPEKPEAKPSAGDNPQALAMLKELFNGLKISVSLEPVGRILKTNSPYVEGQRVTLFEMDFGELLGDPAMLEKMQAAGSIEEAKVFLKGRKGIKVNLDREVTVEFAGAK